MAIVGWLRDAGLRAMRGNARVGAVAVTGGPVLLCSGCGLEPFASGGLAAHLRRTCPNSPLGRGTDGRHLGVAIGLALLLLCSLPLPLSAQQTQMRVRAGFDGNCKEGHWLPAAVDLVNRGDQVKGTLEIAVPGPDGRIATTYHRPVILGSRARQTVALYLKGTSYLGRVGVTLRSPQGDLREESPPLAWLPSEDSLIVVLGRERGALSFLSGTQRPLSGVRARISGGGGPGGLQGEVRVADSSPDSVPDLPQAYQSVDLLVIGEMASQDLRPEAKEAITRWVAAGGTLVVMGGPNWARLKDPFYEQLLPVKLIGAAELGSLSALARAYGAPLGEPAVVTRASPRPGASVLLEQGDVPLIVEGPAGSGRVIFLAFDASRDPVRGWAGQAVLWNSLLDRAQRAALVSQAAATASYGGYGGPPWQGAEELASAVLNVPAMKVPPFWWVALFLAAYLLLLVPVNYGLLKWRRRRELAWLTTPAIVVLFMILAYGIGYGMKGGRLLVNQLSLIETRAGARQAGVITYAGLFSPAKTSYELTPEDPYTVISEAGFDPSETRRRALAVLQTDRMSLPNVGMDMWSMRVFKMEGLAELGEGIEADLSLTSDGSVVGRVMNHTGLDLQGCQVRAGDVSFPCILPDGGAAEVKLSLGGGRPTEVRPADPHQYYYPGHMAAIPGQSPADQMRDAVYDVFFGPGMKAATRGEVLLTGWSDKVFARLAVDGRPRASTSRTFLMVHLPLSLSRRGAVVVPYGVAEGQVVEEQGTSVWAPDQPGVMVGDGYVVEEFRLPPSAGRLKVDRLEVACNYDPGGQSGTAKLQVYNWEKDSWDALPAARGRMPVAAPWQHVRQPQGLVRLRFANHPGGAGAPAAQGPTMGAQSPGSPLRGGGGRGPQRSPMGMPRGPSSGPGMGGGSAGSGEVRLLALDISVRGRVE